MNHFGNTFDKLISKVTARRSSESSILEIPLNGGSERRKSISHPMVQITETESDSADSRKETLGGNRLRAHSMSLVHPSTLSRSRSRSMPRSVSKKHTKELIKQETAQVIQKKLQHILVDLGLQQPIPLKTSSGSAKGPTSRTAKIYVSNSSDCVYLPTASSTSFTYEDEDNGGVYENDSRSGSTVSNGENHTEDSDVTDEINDSGVANEAQPPREMRLKLKSFKSPGFLTSKLDSDVPIAFTMAVIIELKRETTVKDLTFELLSNTTLLWPSGDQFNKTHYKEQFKIGSMEWNFSLSDAFFYINTYNSNDTKLMTVTPDLLAKITRKYRLDPNIADDPVKKFGSFDRDRSDSSASGTANPTSEVYKEGIYVFLLPVLFPANIPATICSINGSLQHTLTVSFNKISEKLNRKTKVIGQYNIPMVRPPPLFANSIADKPIYVNRLWNDSLHYIITFPRKYVVLGCEHLINIKFVPLVKDVIIKRIKFNVLERLTYVSKDLSKEYDYDDEDPNNLRISNKIRERVVTVYELKTKAKPSNSISEPYKEEVIRCPNNNLLFSCYEPSVSNDIENLNLDDPLSKPSNDDDLMVASPLDINVALPFLTTKSDKDLQIRHAFDDHSFRSPSTDSFSNVGSRNASSATNDTPGSPLPPSSPIIGSLETNITHANSELSNNRPDHESLVPDSSAFMNEESNNACENIHQGYTRVLKALYPDSNYRHIQIHHRLQVCFRISKPDPKDNYKMHHYEVVVDTPLILLSARCSEESVQLPRYDEIDLPKPKEPAPIRFRTPNFDRNGVSIRPLSDCDEELPSFEEATSGCGSPITRSISLGENPLSRASSIVPRDPAPAYESVASSNDDITWNSSPLNIDEVVNDARNRTDSNAARFSVKDSLVNSFARDSPLNELYPTLSSSNARDSADAASATISTSSNTNTESLSTNETGISGNLMLNNNEGDDEGSNSSATDPSVSPSQAEAKDSENPPILAYDPCRTSLYTPQNPDTSTSDDRYSINTELSVYEQKLPLLANSSQDEMGSRYSKSVSNISLNKDRLKYREGPSTDNLSVMTECENPQDLYHSY